MHNGLQIIYMTLFFLYRYTLHIDNNKKHYRNPVKSIANKGFLVKLVIDKVFIYRFRKTIIILNKDCYR